MQKNNAGQTTLEYIFLLIVLLGILGLVFRHPFFKGFVEGGSFITEIGTYMQYSYRHAISGQEKEKYPPTYLSPQHDSYQGKAGNTRFFGPKQGYP